MSSPSGYRQQRWPTFLAVTCWRWRRVGICGWLLISAAAAWQAASVGVDNRLTIWFPEEEPARVAYQAFQERFGSDQGILIALSRKGGMLDAGALEMLRRLTTALQQLPGIERVESLATRLDVARTVASGEAVPLLPVGPGSRTAVAELRGQILGDRSLVGTLVSADGTVVAIMAQPGQEADRETARRQLLARVRSLLEGVDATVWMTGHGVIYEALNEAATGGSRILVALAALLSMALLFGYFRRLRVAAVSLLAAASAALWAVGLYAACGRDLNSVSMLLPTLVFVIALTDSIHLATRVLQRSSTGDGRRRFVDGMAATLPPCLFNSVTTALAFGAFAASGMPVLRDFGLFAAAGLLAGLVATLLVNSWGLPWASSRQEPVTIGTRGRSMATRLVQFGLRRPRTVLGAVAACLVVAASGAGRLEVDTEPLAFFTDRHPVRQQALAIERRLGPWVPLEFELATDDGDLFDPPLLAAVADWQRAVESAGLAGWSRSLPDLLAVIEPVDPGLASDPRAVVALLQQVDPGAVRALVDTGQSRLRVTFGLPLGSARAAGRTVERIAVLADLPGGVALQATGYLPLYVRMTRYLVATQATSLLIAVPLVLLLIGLLLRSWRLLLAVPANVVPLALVFGGMGLAGLRLDVGTVTVGAVLLGLIVDDSVHLLYRLREAADGGVPLDAAIAVAAADVGPALLATSAVLAVGFLVIGCAEVRTVAWFGRIVLGGVIAAAVADLLVTPALLGWLAQRTPTPLIAMGGRP